MIKNIVPGPSEIAREALIVIGGAIVAAFLISHVPALRDWIKDAWNTPSGK